MRRRLVRGAQICGVQSMSEYKAARCTDTPREQTQEMTEDRQSMKIHSQKTTKMKFKMEYETKTKLYWSKGSGAFTMPGGKQYRES